MPRPLRGIHKGRPPPAEVRVCRANHEPAQRRDAACASPRRGLPTCAPTGAWGSDVTRSTDLRQLHAWLKDPGLGGLVRVQNKRQEFLWVHPQFEEEY